MIFWPLHHPFLAKNPRNKGSIHKQITTHSDFTGFFLLVFFGIYLQHVMLRSPCCIAPSWSTKLSKEGCLSFQTPKTMVSVLTLATNHTSDGTLPSRYPINWQVYQEIYQPKRGLYNQIITRAPTAKPAIDVHSGHSGHEIVTGTIENIVDTH